MISARGVTRMAVVAAMVLLAVPALAGETHWILPPPTVGDWFEPGNWENGVPDPGDSAYIDNGGTAALASGDSASADYLYVGNLNSGNYLQTGGTATFGSTSPGSRHVYVGTDPGSTGAITVQGGSFTCGGQLAVGNSGTGVFRQTGGLVSSSNTVALGFLGSGDGTYEISGNSQLEVAGFWVGRYGTGRVIQDGGSVTSNDQIALGHSSPTGPADGTYELRSGMVSAKVFVSGFEGQGSVLQSGGTMSITGYSSIDYLGLVIGSCSKSHGTYQLTGGCLLVEYKCYIGLYGNGEIEQSGGTTDFESDLLVGAYAQKYEIDYATGTYNQSGGTNRIRGKLYVGYGGAHGQYTLCGGINTVDTDLVIGYGDHADGTYQVASGELAVDGLLQVGRLGLGCFEVHGTSGTVSASSYEQNTRGTLISVIDGTGISAIDVKGEATLGGTWTVLDNGACFGRFDVLSSGGGLSGIFENVNLPSSDWSYGIDGNVVWVQHVPEPATLSLLAAGLALLRRKRVSEGKR